MKDITREDFNFIIRESSRKTKRIPRVIYHEVYSEVEKRSAKNIHDLAKKYKIPMIDVLESECLFPVAAQVCKDKYGVSHAQ